MNDFGLRQRQALVGGAILIMAALHPVTNYFLERHGPPCSTIVNICRSEGILYYSNNMSRDDVYDKCLAPAIANKRVGASEIPRDLLRMCKRFLRRARGD